MQLTDPLLPVSMLIDRLHERDQRFHDKLVAADDLSVDSDTGNLIVRNGTSQEHPFQPQALKLLASKLRVPHSYLTRCEPELRATNLNWWLRRKSGQRFFLRFDQDEIRAVLSPRYEPVSNLEIAEEVQKRAGNVSVRCELDQLRMLLQVIHGRSVEASPGDRLHPGMHIRNSEVGFMAVELKAMIFRSICTNGLILGSSAGTAFRRRHITVSDEVMFLFGGALAKAIDAGASLPGQFADTMFIMVPDPELVFDRIAKRYDFDEVEQDAIWTAYSREPGKTLYHVINGITGAANNLALSVESRERLQETGGRIMELASNGTRWID